MVRANKNIVFSALILILSAGFWYEISRWVGEGASLTDWHAWIWSFGFLILLSAVIGVAFLIEKVHWIHWINSLLILVPLFFIFPLNVKYLIPFGVLFIFQHIGVKRIHDESTQRFKIDIYHIMRMGMSWIIVPILILISFAYYLSPQIQASKDKQELPPMVKNISDKAVDFFVNQVANIPRNQQQSIAVQIKNEILGQLNTWFEPYSIFLPSILAFGLFLILWSLSWVFVWLSVFMSMVIFYVLKTSGYLKIEEVDVKAERIIYG